MDRKMFIGMAIGMIIGCGGVIGWRVLENAAEATRFRVAIEPSDRDVWESIGRLGAQSWYPLVFFAGIAVTMAIVLLVGQP